MTPNWELLLDADMSNGDWQFSTVTDCTSLKVDQENAPSLGRFVVAQVSPDLSEFLDIKPYPARSEATRIALDYPGRNDKRIAIKHGYSEFPDQEPNNWRIKIYGAKIEFNPPVNPQAVVITLDPRVAGAVPVGEKGIPLGVATLNEDGIVPDEQLPHSEWTELLGANLAATDALAIQLENLVIPAAPTLESLGAEPVGAETRARQYTDEQINAIAFPPAPTLASLGGEPQGAELRAKQYVDQRFPPTITPTTDIRINCGCPIDYTAADGKVWLKDTYANFGNADTNYLGVIGATYDFVLFNYSRSGGGGGFNYKIPVPNGNYKVELGFSENWHSNVNSRKFHVEIEGIRVLSDFDIRAQAGARYTAIKRVFNATVSDGELNLIFTPTLDGAQINNIRIYSA